jgi:hypothetical protein
VEDLLKKQQLSAAPFFDGLLYQPHASAGVLQPGKENPGYGRGVRLAQEDGVREFLLLEQVFHFADEFRRNDMLALEHPQPFQEHSQSNDGAKNDGVNENTPFGDKVHGFRSPGTEDSMMTGFEQKRTMQRLQNMIYKNGGKSRVMCSLDSTSSA